MGPQTTKRSIEAIEQIKLTDDDDDPGFDLFVDAPPDHENSAANDADSTDTESSVYSDLEDESDEGDDESDLGEEEDGEESESEESESNESVASPDEVEETTEDVEDGRLKTEAKREAIPPNLPVDSLISNADGKSPAKNVVGLKEQLKTAPKTNEYEFDSSDEEDLRNTIGNVPIEWYNEYPHIGYDLDGKQILKPATKDELDKFLSKMEDPNYWRTVHDKQTGKDVVLTDEDVEIIQKIQSGGFPGGSYDPYLPFEDTYSHEVEIHPLTNRPEHKRSFLPSKIEKQKVSKLVHAIKMGWIKPKKSKEDTDRFYLLWNDDEKGETSRRIMYHIPAPKMKLPGHEESYNPPPEYLFTEEEKRAWLDKDPEDRKLEYLPTRYPNLRSVPAYKYFINERFDRCLDLYLCPRQRKMRMNVDPEDLIPKLPKPKDLQPFPTTLSLIYKGHTDMVRCVTVEPTGQFLASGSDDKSVKIWEVITGRCLKTISVEGPVKSLAWCINTNVCLLACVVNKDVLIINPGVGDRLIISNTDAALSAAVEGEQKGSGCIQWKVADEAKKNQDIRLIISHPKEIQQVTWHGRGDYFATVMPNAGNKAVHVHQLTKQRSQQPFTKSKGLVQCVLFHPSKPYIFVATQRYVRIYNLMKQELTKKLLTNCKWVSSMAIHSGGDHVIIGSFDSRLSWFDLDLSTKPYQTLRHHKQAVRQVAFHHRYPLFASASDDCSVIVCHGMVYNDLLQNPLIVPVKVLRGHSKTNDLGVLDCVFHPTQPWVFSSGADGTVRLYT